jgi:hypothetical protein
LESINVSNKGDKTMKLSEIKMNEIETRSYREYFGSGRFYDNVEEYSFITSESLTYEEYCKVLKDAGKYIWGSITVIKKQLTQAGRIIGYKHILKAAMSPN